MAGKYMEETEINVNPAVTEERLATLIEEAATRYGLRIHMKGTLRTYPGSQHWHLHKPGERGTLEVTLWSARKRLWLSVQAGRRANWITELLAQFKAWLEEQMSTY